MRVFTVVASSTGASSFVCPANPSQVKRAQRADERSSKAVTFRQGGIFSKARRTTEAEIVY